MKLKAMGWAMLRFWGEDILADANGCAVNMLRRLKKIGGKEREAKNE